MDRIYYRGVAIGDIEPADAGRGYYVKSYHSDSEWFAHNKKWAIESLRDEARTFSAKPQYDPIGDLTPQEIEWLTSVLGVQNRTAQAV